MSAEASTSTPQQAAPQQQQQQQQQASTPAANVPPSGASAMPSAGANRVAEGLLAQTDILKDDSQRKSEALQRMEQRNAYLEAQMAKQLQSYRAKQLPKLEQYIKEIEETTGTPLGEESKKKYYNLFTSPDNEEEVERMTQVMQRTVNLVASKKAADEELARMKADHATLVETMSKVSQKMGGGVNMRQAYAEAVSGNSASGTDQNQKQVEIAASRTRDDSQRRTNARSMFSPHNPTAKEAEWLAEFGYANTTDVNIAASSDNGVQSLRPLPTSFPKPATHQLLYTKEGEKQFPYSMREYNEDLFGVALQQKDARPDVLNELTYVSINSTDDFTCNAYK